MSFQVCLGQVDRHELDVIGVTKLGKIFHWKFNPHSSTSPKIRILDQLVSIRFQLHRYLMSSFFVLKLYQNLFCTQILCLYFFARYIEYYQTLISLFFRFSLLSLRVFSIGRFCLYIKMAKLNSKKQKKSLFYEEISLIRLTPGNTLFCF
jgi:hypothetical protein